jgi:predicted DCC family thiol-disulfide oxidoreductase YuxK
MGSSLESKPILLFDGECNLCNLSVQFILKHEKNEELRFAAIQSTAGQEKLAQYNMVRGQLDSVLLIMNGRVYAASDAAILLSDFLKFPWSMGRYLRAVPRPIRNVFYEKIAKNRYRWFGKKDSCMLPSEPLRKRFLK